MALFPKTPGVYIKEVSLLPPSVAAVATGIPAFIGYTEKGPTSPIRITSLLEYTSTFGGPQHEAFAISISDPSPPAEATIADTTASSAISKYNLYYQLQMYFANGGGPCYVISAGTYNATVGTSPVTANLDAALQRAEEIDEPTILCIPEAISGTVVQATLNNNMLTQCAKLKDRFAVMDVKVLGTSIVNDASTFRSSDVGNNNLKYGASYYPSLKTTLTRFFLDDEVITTDTRTTGALYNNAPNNTLFAVRNGVSAWGGITILDTTGLQGDSITINLTPLTATAVAPTTENQFQSTGTTANTANNLAIAINNHSILSAQVFARVSGNVVTVLAVNSGTDANLFPFTTTAGITDATLQNNAGNTLNGGINNSIDSTLYNRIVSLLNTKYALELYPSATMAGIYASVDRDRGVWKSPANVSLNLVTLLSVNVTDDDQAGLNVDAVGGKSINAIRNFPGRGILVWGARTLDGNSNEWRYVNVRRLFIMVEESTKKASEFVVFEPNDKNTWNRVKGMISNFLTNLWKDGALMGDKPEQAYFVKVGLNETMSAQDILEGKLIVQIGLAAVRPAEFIILEFSHKLQEA